MKALKFNLDLALVILVIGGFVFIATQRLETVPVPDTDESYMLQTSYQMLYRGKLALPLRRFLGGNIENTWHSLTPLYYVIESGFLKVFGWGLLQGRLFNLLTVVLTLIMVYLIGRRLFDWRAGLIAVVMITSDQTVLERSRLLRNDYAAEAFALLAFYLYEVAEQRKSRGWFVASGLACGAGVMCHTSIFYVLGAICLVMVLRGGWRTLSSKKLYQFAGGALAVMAYEIISGVIDYKNLLLQYRDDQMHFGFLSPSGWLGNLADEPTRYLRWYTAYDVTFPNVPRTLLHLFQFLSIAAIVYLIVRCGYSIRRGSPMSEPRVRLLIVTALMMLFFANVAHKLGYYNAHLVTWFGLCVGSMLSDFMSFIWRLPPKPWPSPRLIHATALAVSVLAVVVYGLLLVRQDWRYLRELRNPDLASFEELKAALNSIVPDDVCPVAVKAPVIWLAFPEKDQCFATIERRMNETVDIEGKDYALLVRPKSPDYWARALGRQHNLLGELSNTPYGNFLVYYTGIDQRYVEREPRRYHFFRRWRGLVTDEQIAQAREVWSASATELSTELVEASVTGAGLRIKLGQGGSTDDLLTRICSVELKPSTAYELVMDVKASEECEAIVIEETTGAWLKQIEIDGDNQLASVSDLFRTLETKRVRIAFRGVAHRSTESLFVSRIGIREIRAL
ncbi:MAG TPA: glycosyltransferase family 39 protein [Blastocatellia bacterium]|nr:glycosyltransferase family 39 protein [Blastocatellia bacterium]